jgi:hypothetical protein
MLAALSTAEGSPLRAACGAVDAEDETEATSDAEAGAPAAPLLALLAACLPVLALRVVVSGLAVAAAEAALADPGFTRDSVLRIISARGDLADGLAALGYATLPSRTNFVAFDSGEDAVALVARMGARGVHIREWRDPGFETFARITVGTPQENVAALKALADCRTCLAAGAAAPVGSAARG